MLWSEVSVSNKGGYHPASPVFLRFQVEGCFRHQRRRLLDLGSILPRFGRGSSCWGLEFCFHRSWIEAKFGVWLNSPDDVGSRWEDIFASSMLLFPHRIPLGFARHEQSTLFG